MASTREMLLWARLDAAALETWVEAGWLAPHGGGAGGGGGGGGDEGAFTEQDLARACLIRDLRDELGINDEGVGVVLDLLDQLHGLRLALRRVTASVQALPEPLRREVLAVLRRPGPEPGGEGEPPAGGGSDASR